MLDEIFEKAKGVAKVATDKTTEMVEVSKMKMKCVKIDSEIKSLYEKIGREIFMMRDCNSQPSPIIDNLSEKITDLISQQKLLNEKISDLKNIIKCVSCQNENVKDSLYCNKCGIKLTREDSESNNRDDNYSTADQSDSQSNN